MSDAQQVNSSAPPADKPPKSAFVLLALVTGAIVSNISLSIANVALPSIGRDLSASQAELTQIANAFALGLASTVLYFGALADRYGRKLMFVLGAILTVPTALISAFAPNPEILILGRFTSGLAAALLFPTTLSLISSLYRNHAKVTAIALWSGVGGGVAALGPVLGGWLLEYFWWGSVFLIAIPIVLVALIIGLFVLPWKCDEDSRAVDHLGGVLSIIGVLLLVITIEQVANGLEWTLLWTFLISLVFLALFFWRQTKAARPLIYLPLLKARTLWVAFVAGSITFGSLIGSLFIGQQFSQNVLGYSALLAAVVVLPTAIGTMIFGQVAGKLVVKRGSKISFSLGLISVAIAFAIMLITWTTDASMGWVLAGYAFVGIGVGLSVTPASRALMGSVPPARAGMGSAFLDLTRDLGGAIIQAVMGTFLAATYAISVRAQLTDLPESEASKVTSTVSSELASSYSSAAEVASKYTGQTSEAILSGAAEAFTQGKTLAIGVALALTLIGLATVLIAFPNKEKENEYYQKVLADNG
jgi:MFS transporter, DHA2 family, multidrug resistance protein